MATKTKDPRRVAAGRKAAETRRANKLAAEQREQEQLEQQEHQQGQVSTWIPWLLFVLALIALLYFWRPWATTPANPDTVGAGAGVVVPPQDPPATAVPVVVAPATPVPTEVAPATPVTPTAEVDFNEPLQGSLDDFGVATRYDDRFPLGDGMIWDQSYNPGEILVGNMYATHDNGFVSQKGCVVVYYMAGTIGGRVRFIAWDGQAFELNAGNISLNQAIAAMRETLIQAHGCNASNIEYHELVRYGDPVK